jgi:hypothetical protein
MHLRTRDASLTRPQGSSPRGRLDGTRSARADRAQPARRPTGTTGCPGDGAGMAEEDLPSRHQGREKTRRSDGPTIGAIKGPPRAMGARPTPFRPGPTRSSPPSLTPSPAASSPPPQHGEAGATRRALYSHAASGRPRVHDVSPTSRSACLPERIETASESARPSALVSSEPRYPRGTGGCRNLPMNAAGCWNRIPAFTQALWLCTPPPKTLPDCHGKEGVAGSSPAEGFRNRATARFPYFRSGTGDHFLAQRKGSSV